VATVAEQIQVLDAGFRPKNGDEKCYSARAAGARLRFTYRAEIAASSTPQNFACGINIDSIAASADWLELCFATGNATISHPLIFEITAPDTLSYTYTILFFRNASAANIVSISRRRLAIEEFAI
jgi:hypothetical protein